MRKILQILAIIILVILPYFPVAENFFPPESQVNNDTFITYILICSVLIILGFLLMWFQKPNRNSEGWLLFAIGLVAMIPLHLGPPRMGADLLIFSGIEKFRYGLLILATILLFFAGLKIISPVNNIQSKIILAVLCIATLLNLWDNYSSFMLNRDMENWIANGKNTDDFVLQFDFQTMWRTFARISLYLATIALIYKSGIKKWQFALLTVFSLIGIIFCFLCLINFPDYYFPFMIPAIALAPAYWMGIAVLTKK